MVAGRCRWCRWLVPLQGWRNLSESNAQGLAAHPGSGRAPSPIGWRFREAAVDSGAHACVLPAGVSRSEPHSSPRLVPTQSPAGTGRRASPDGEGLNGDPVVPKASLAPWGAALRSAPTCLGHSSSESREGLKLSAGSAWGPEVARRLAPLLPPVFGLAKRRSLRQPPSSKPRPSIRLAGTRSRMLQIAPCFCPVSH